MAQGANPNTSATGGYLGPTSPPNADDRALDAILQSIVVGITGLDGKLVRPRWQMTVTGNTAPRVPNADVDWCAVEVAVTTPDDVPAFIQNGQGDGSSILRRYLTLDVLASFYGPSSDAYAGILRDGLYVSQNREAMGNEGLNLIDTDPIRRVPEIINTLTRRRSDLPFRLRRRVERAYSVLNVLGAEGTVHELGGSQAGPAVRDIDFTVEP